MLGPAGVAVSGGNIFVTSPSNYSGAGTIGEYPVTGVSAAATDVDKLTPDVDLEITKTDNSGGSSITGAAGTAFPGHSITYTIVASNTGPSQANGVSVVDTLPSSLVGITYTAVTTGGASGFTASGSGSIDDTNLTLPGGSTITYTVHATVGSSASGTLSNTATLLSTQGAPINASLITGLDEPQAVAVSGGDLYVASAGTIGEYNATTGATINASLITGLGLPFSLVVSGEDLYVADLDGTIGEYNAITGAPINAALVTGQGSPIGIAVSGGDLFVVNSGADGSISEYNATTGATINASLVTGLSDPYGVAVLGGDLFVTNSFYNPSSFYPTGSISEYTTSGVLVNASLVSGIPGPYALTESGGDLFVANYNGGTVGEYTTSGATVNPALISVQYPTNVAVVGSDVFVTSQTAGTVGEYNLGTTSANDTDNIAAATGLEITKTDNLGGSSISGTLGTAVPGTAITYTIVASNSGPSNVTGALIIDTLSGTLTGTTYTAVTTGGASGFTASGSGNIDDTDVDMPPGSTVTYTVHATIASSAAGTLSNAATLTQLAGATTTATDADTLMPQADLEITKTDDWGGSSVTGAIGKAVPGQAIAYTIFVTNVGPSDAAGTSIVDALPSCAYRRDLHGHGNWRCHRLHRRWYRQHRRYRRRHSGRRHRYLHGARHHRAVGHWCIVEHGNRDAGRRSDRHRFRK